MTTSPPQSETGRGCPRPAAMNVSKRHRRHRVNPRGLRCWLEVAGGLVELAQRDPERGLRYLETWSRRMRRALGHPVRLAPPGGNQR
jgi:hypothetical protein